MVISWSGRRAPEQFSTLFKHFQSEYFIYSKQRIVVHLRSCAFGCMIAKKVDIWVDALFPLCYGG
jgi:hypothetical protein